MQVAGTFNERFYFFTADRWIWCRTEVFLVWNYIKWVINDLNWNGMKRETQFFNVPLCYHAAAKEYIWYGLVSGGNFGHAELITSSQAHTQCHPFNILEICFAMLGTAGILSCSLKGHYLHWEGTNIYAQTFAWGLLKSIQIQVIPFSATSLPWKYKEIVLIFWQSSAL